MIGKKISVLLVDDSAVIRKVMEKMLSSVNDVATVYIAHDTYQAESIIQNENPDIVLLDINMPDRDGITFLKIIMQSYRRPVIMLSALDTSYNSQSILDLGAIDVLFKPNGMPSSSAFKNKLAESIQKAMAPIACHASQSLDPVSKNKFNSFES